MNFALIPEVPFALDAFLAALKQRMLTKSHAVIAVAEGAGQDLLAADASARDASGNVKLHDIGPFLRGKIEAFFKAEGIPIVVPESYLTHPASMAGTTPPALPATLDSTSQIIQP